MPLTPLSPAGRDLAEAFEARLRADPAADLDDFTPAPGSADFVPVAVELARLDMEYAWDRGRPRPPDYYLDRYPALAADPDAVAAVVFEDYRIRKLGGEAVTPGSYARRYAVDVTGWPVDAGRAEKPDPLLDEYDRLARTAVLTHGRPGTRRGRPPIGPRGCGRSRPTS